MSQTPPLNQIIFWEKQKITECVQKGKILKMKRFVYDKSAFFSVR